MSMVVGAILKFLVATAVGLSFCTFVTFSAFSSMVDVASIEKALGSTHSRVGLLFGRRLCHRAERS